jgi:hypothetical protein
MIKPYRVLTIDADYWMPYEQGDHCGFCSDRRRPFYRRSVQFEEVRVHPTIEELVKKIRPKTPILISESHAEMFFILRRLRYFLNRKEPSRRIHVTNIDEHSDTNSVWFPIYGGGLVGYLDPFIPVKRGRYELDCGNWVMQSNDTTTKISYLDEYKWIGCEEDWRETRLPTPDLVHVCRSAPYMSRAGDGHFVDLVLALEQQSGVQAEIVDHGHSTARSVQILINKGRKAA